jgi:hypothetical protein
VQPHRALVLAGEVVGVLVAEATTLTVKPFGALKGRPLSIVRRGRRLRPVKEVPTGNWSLSWAILTVARVPSTGSSQLPDVYGLKSPVRRHAVRVLARGDEHRVAGR